ncbi:hypothetical protein [Paenibacillus wenxiniae]|uniref:Uncharacterized protein n=1 Tax=Paenibacillus wenxiniae TaxID=1636843 RepID=A0ABW4RIA5_9BACL
MVDLLLSNLYIIVIIAFAIFTAISSRSGKNKSRNTRPGMPTFGGGPDTPGRRLPGSAPTTQEREEDAQRRYHEAQRQFDQEQMNRGLGEGESRRIDSQEGTYGSEGASTSSSSSEGSRAEGTMDIGRTADQYRNELQQRLNQLGNGVNERLDRMNLASQETVLSDSSRASSTSTASGELRLDASQAAQGVLWAEILSPPRSRHVGSFGRKASREQHSNEA